MRVHYRLGGLDYVDRIGTYIVIDGCQGQSMLQRLTDEHAVEGITMQERQFSQSNDASLVQCKAGNLVAITLVQ